MEYRSVADLNSLIIERLNIIPAEVDLIVGVPRSGVMVASLLALHLNLRFTDVDGFINGKIFDKGMAREQSVRAINSIDECRKILVIDDSVHNGTEMKRVKSVIDEAGLGGNTIFATAYCNPAKQDLVDIAFELTPPKRVFEWNLMHHEWLLGQTCMDIDGVLCRDPVEEENDDGEKYKNFLTTVTTLYRPTVEVKTLVTSRLEKYRGETEAWLKANGVRYQELKMMGYATMAERRAARAYATFKADIYRASDAILFVESADDIAGDIARLSGKPVLSIESNMMFGPSGVPLLKQKTKMAKQDAIKFSQRVFRKLKRCTASLLS